MYGAVAPMPSAGLTNHQLSLVSLLLGVDAPSANVDVKSSAPKMMEAEMMGPMWMQRLIENKELNNDDRESTGDVLFVVRKSATNLHQAFVRQHPPATAIGARIAKAWRRPEATN